MAPARICMGCSPTSSSNYAPKQWITHVTTNMRELLRVRRYLPAMYDEREMLANLTGK